MKIEPFPFSVIDWDFVEVTEHSGEAGVALWRTRFFHDSEKFGKMWVRMVEYSAGYRRTIGAKKGTFYFAFRASSRSACGTGGWRLYALG